MLRCCCRDDHDYPGEQGAVLVLEPRGAGYPGRISTISYVSLSSNPSNTFNANPAVQVIPNGGGLGTVAAEQRRGEEQHEPHGSGCPIEGTVVGV
jgi:hypothetical protein